jgi:hypothetical protein
MGALRQDGLADETVGPNITDLSVPLVQVQCSEWSELAITL